MLKVYTTIVVGFIVVVSAYSLSSVSFLGLFYISLGFRFPNRRHMIVVFRTCERDCGRARTGERSRRRMRRCFWKKTFIARYDFMDIKGSALGLGKRKVW